MSAWARDPSKATMDNFRLRCLIHESPGCKAFARSAKLGMEFAARSFAAGRPALADADAAERRRLRDLRDQVEKPRVAKTK